MVKAKYTVVLKTLLDDPQVRPLIDQAMSTYPIYQQKSKEEFIPSIIPTREELNRKILNFYKYREIGFETVGRFIEELEVSLNEIMPYYNQLMFSTDQDYNIIFNVDYSRETDENRSGNTDLNKNGSDSRRTTGDTLTTSRDQSTANSKAIDDGTTVNDASDYSKSIKSSTPQSELGITAKNMDSVNYADDVSWNGHDTDGKTTVHGETSGKTTTVSDRADAGSSSITESGSNNQTEKGSHAENAKIIERIKGNYGQVSVQSLVDRYRDLIINIEQLIINDARISELFMMVY